MHIGELDIGDLFHLPHTRHRATTRSTGSASSQQQQQQQEWRASSYAAGGPRDREEQVQQRLLRGRIRRWDEGSSPSPEIRVRAWAKRSLCDIMYVHNSLPRGAEAAVRLPAADTASIPPHTMPSLPHQPMCARATTSRGRSDEGGATSRPRAEANAGRSATTPMPSCLRRRRRLAAGAAGSRSQRQLVEKIRIILSARIIF